MPSALGAAPSIQGTPEDFGADLPVVEPNRMVFDHPHDPDVDHLAKGEAALSRGDAEASLEQFQKAAFDLGTYEAFLGVGRAARASAKRDLAILAFQAAADLDREEAAPLIQAARLSLAKDDIVVGLGFIDKAIAREPLRAESHNVRGRLWMAKEQYHKAVIALDRAIDVDPAYVWAYNNLGYVHLLTGEYEEAIDVLEIATALTPVKAYMWNNLGLAYEKSGRVVDAHRAFNEALSMRPGYVNAQINLTRVNSRVAMAPRKTPPVKVDPSSSDIFVNF